MKSLKQYLQTFQSCGWKLKETIDFHDARKSKNYIFESGDGRTRCLYTEHGVVKAVNCYDPEYEESSLF